MKKKININMFLLTVISIIFTTILLMFTFYNVLNRQMERELKSQAIFFENSLNFSSDNLEYINSLKLTKRDARVSIIKPDGTVVFDSYKEAQTMENHSDRPEIKEAFAKGYGQSTRFSSTLGEKTLYYAVKLNDNTVLRLARTTNFIFDILTSVLPMTIAAIIISFLLCNILTVKLTKRIIEPINNIDLTKEQGSAYEELAPFIRAINKQKKQINKQFLTLEDRSNTITTITENMKEGLLLLDKNGSILLMNNSVLDFFQAGEDTYIGKNILEFTRNMDLQNGIKKTLSGAGCDITFRFDTKTVQVFLSPVFAKGILNGAIALFLDITDKAGTEKMRKEFSANVSHELKTPLTTISGYAEIINNDMVKPDDIKKFSGKIKDESARLVALIEDIIKLSQLDENVHKNEFTDFDIKAAALEVTRSLQPSADIKNITLSVTGGKKIINADNQMIFEMLYNLVDNGIKYNKVNGNVTVTVSDENGKTRIEVADTGIGIENVHLERIFERFYRVDKSRSKKTGGTGLGLSIVKHVVEYHGGTINIQSTLDTGTKIIVII